LGEKQADRLGHWLANGSRLDNGNHLEFAGLMASPYVRAQQTAVAVGRAKNVPIRTDESLREASFLVSDYLPSAEAPGRPFGYHQLSQPYADFRSQASQALDNLVASAEELSGPVMAISHGGLISTMLRLATGSESVSFWIYNATVHLIEWKRGRWHLVYLNLWDHLSPELRTY
jgi:probable phosphoglycerate mutase